MQRRISISGKGGKCVETLAYPLHPLHDPVQGGIDHPGLGIGMAISFSSVGKPTRIAVQRSAVRYLGVGPQSEFLWQRDIFESCPHVTGIQSVGSPMVI
jgi:hypothetical protein